jgi:hypothetical protein
MTGPAALPLDANDCAGTVAPVRHLICHFLNGVPGRKVNSFCAVHNCKPAVFVVHIRQAVGPVKDAGQCLNIIAAPLHFISVNAPLAILLPLAALSVMRVGTGERFFNGFLLSVRP